MARIDLNALLDGCNEPRVGDEYEVAPGKWGKLKSPTIELQEKVFALVEAGSADGNEDRLLDIEMARLVLDGLPDFDPKNAVSGMASKVTQDFFTLLAKIVERLTPESKG
jgi:hypothetical protein